MCCLTETMNQLVKNSLKVSALHCKKECDIQEEYHQQRGPVTPVLLVSPSQQNTLSMSKNDRIRPRALVSSFLIRSLKTLCTPRSLTIYKTAPSKCFGWVGAPCTC